MILLRLAQSLGICPQAGAAALLSAHAGGCRRRARCGSALLSGLALAYVPRMLHRTLLLLLELAHVVCPLLRILGGLLPRLLELALVVGLLLIVRALARLALWRLRGTSRLIDRMLALFLVVRLLVLALTRRALRRLARVRLALERGLLVALSRMHGPALVVERILLVANPHFVRNHSVARLLQTMVDQDSAVAVVLCDTILVAV